MPLVSDVPVVEERAEVTARRTWPLNLACGLLFAAIFALFFYATVFLGEPISRLSLLGGLDSLYDPSFKSSQSCWGVDPATYCLAIPVQFLVERLWSSMQLPLWNPFNGCGHPLIGDPQSFVFSPFYFLFSTRNAWIYNLGIVVKPILAAVAIFGMARLLGLSRAASIFSALGYAMCPNFLHSAEMPNQQLLVPFMFWSFLWLAESVTVPRFLVTSLVIAGFFTFTHPECYVWAAVFSSLLFAAHYIAIRGWSWSRLGRAIGTIAGVAAVSIALAGPMLFPFIEYLAHSDCYKSAIENFSGRPISWMSLLYSLVNPGYGGGYPREADETFGVGSPFLGIIIALLLPLGIMSKRRNTFGLIALTVVALVVITRTGPAELLNLEPLAYLMPMYALPALLLPLALLGGFGFDALIANKWIPTRSQWIQMAAITAIVAFLPLALVVFQISLAECYIEGSIRSMQVDFFACIRDLVIIGAFVSILLLRWKINPALIIGLVLLLNIGSEASSASAVLPIQEKFSPQVVEPLPVAKKRNERVVACGLHLMLPNTNCIYGMQDLRLHNPLTPKRYVDFITAAGAHREALYVWTFDNSLNSLLDLAGIRYVLSQEPVSRSDDALPPLERLSAFASKSLVIEPGSRLDDVAMAYDPADLSVRGNFTWKVHARTSGIFGVEPVVLDSNDQVVWWGNRRQMRGRFDEDHILHQAMSFAVPASFRPGEKFKVGIRLWDGVHKTPLVPKYSPVEIANGTAVLKEFVVQPVHVYERIDRHLRLVSDPKQPLRLYENTTPMPSAWLVADAQVVSSEVEALNAIKNPNFDPRERVVLEGRETKTTRKVSRQDAGAPRTVGASVNAPRAVRPNVNELIVDVDAAQDSYLVFNETWYPGWRASVDGKTVPLLHGDYLFRCVQVPQGKHLIEFKYEPISFWFGVFTFTLAALGSAILLARGLLSRRRMR
jgi:hypothetical protein